jgi:hypothetical protein
MNFKAITKMEGDPIENIDVIKGFHLYQKRNERVDWHGDTAVVPRTLSAKLTKSESENSAERMRERGTKFFIDEVPMLCFKGKNGLLLVYQKYSNNPFTGIGNICNDFVGISKLGDAAKIFSKSNKFLYFYEPTGKELTPVNDCFFTRESSPGKGKSSLAWTLTLRKVDAGAVKRLCSALKVKSNLAEPSHQPDGDQAVVLE